MEKSAVSAVAAARWQRAGPFNGSLPHPPTCPQPLPSVAWLYGCRYTWHVSLQLSHSLHREQSARRHP